MKTRALLLLLLLLHLALLLLLTSSVPVLALDLMVATPRPPGARARHNGRGAAAPGHPRKRHHDLVSLVVLREVLHWARRGRRLLRPGPATASPSLLDGSVVVFCLTIILFRKAREKKAASVYGYTMTRKW